MATGAHARVARRELGRDASRGGVARSVVPHHQFPMRVDLRLHRVERGAQQCARRVAGGHHHADQRLALHALGLCPQRGQALPQPGLVALPQFGVRLVAACRCTHDRRLGIGLAQVCAQQRGEQTAARGGAGLRPSREAVEVEQDPAQATQRGLPAPDGLDIHPFQDELALGLDRVESQGAHVRWHLDDLAQIAAPCDGQLENPPLRITRTGVDVELGQRAAALAQIALDVVPARIPHATQCAGEVEGRIRAGGAPFACREVERRCIAQRQDGRLVREAGHAAQQTVQQSDPRAFDGQRPHAAAPASLARRPDSS